MSPTVFGVAFTLGAVALALWADARARKLVPSEMRWVFVHTAVVFAVLHGVRVAVVPLIESGPPIALVALIGLALPAVAYAFLVGIWTVRFLQEATAGFR